MVARQDVTNKFRRVYARVLKWDKARGLDEVVSTTATARIATHPFGVGTARPGRTRG